MTSISLFSTTPTVVSAATFSALAPQAQCELVLLISERRVTPASIGKAIGRTAAEVAALRAQRPLYRLANLEGGADPDAKGGRAQKVGIGRSARRILRLFALSDDGVIHLDRDAIARRADLSTGMVKTAMDQLRDKDMIELKKPGKAFSPAIWELKDAGRAEIARISDGDDHA